MQKHIKGHLKHQMGISYGNWLEMCKSKETGMNIVQKG